MYINIYKYVHISIYEDDIIYFNLDYLTMLYIPGLNEDVQLSIEYRANVCLC